MTDGAKRPRGRPREIGITRRPEEPVRSQLPEDVYDLYCQAAGRRRLSVRSYIRNILIAYARVKFIGPDKSKSAPAVGQSR